MAEGISWDKLDDRRKAMVLNKARELRTVWEALVSTEEAEAALQADVDVFVGQMVLRMCREMLLRLAKEFING